MKPRLFVACGVDVEEEGLFQGRYARLNPQITNTAWLDRLAPLCEIGLRPTLFCAYSAFADARSRKMLETMRDKHGMEIGAHLHHWNTPPIDDSPHQPRFLANVPSAGVGRSDLEQKLDHLFQIANNFQGQPVTSFRMGRWDLHRDHWQLLVERGVLCDASVRPMHMAHNPLKGPDHFDAPADPYRVGSNGVIFEVPLTVVPIISPLASIPWGALRASLRHWGALALLPVNHPLWLMKLVTKLHARRSGQVISLAWHSSEMMPGGSPHLRTEASVSRFLAKMETYLEWLNANFAIEAFTMEGLRKRLAPSSPIRTAIGDWAPELDFAR